MFDCGIVEAEVKILETRLRVVAFAGPLMSPRSHRLTKESLRGTPARAV